MFTGIVEEAGEVIGIDETEGGRRVRVAGSFADELSHGQSIAVSGCCLTVEEYSSDWFELFLSQETIERTYLGSVGIGDSVNLERAMPADGRFDGHIAQGHVDATAQVTRIEQVGDDWTFGFSIPGGCSQYIVEKGSIAVDGISLTVADRSDEEFTAAIIPATYELTNLSEKQVSDPVHIEVDVIAKYVERMVGDQEDSTENPDVPLP